MKSGVEPIFDQIDTRNVRIEGMAQKHEKTRHDFSEKLN